MRQCEHEDTVREDADEGNLLGETLDVGIFNAGEIAFVDAAGVEAVLEGIDVAELTARTAGGRRGMGNPWGVKSG